MAGRQAGFPHRYRKSRYGEDLRLAPCYLLVSGLLFNQPELHSSILADRVFRPRPGHAEGYNCQHEKNLRLGSIRYADAATARSTCRGSGDCLAPAAD